MPLTVIYKRLSSLRVEGRLRKCSRSMYEAVCHGSLKEAESFLEDGADVNFRRDRGRGTALQVAVTAGHEGMVKLLLGYGAEIGSGEELYTAGYNGHEQVAQLLIEYGANVNAEFGYYGNALKAAIGEAHDALTTLLLKEGADVNAIGGVFGSALQVAACRGNEAVIKKLLGKGADINVEGGEYGNALMAAVFCEHERMVKLLVDFGARFPRVAEPLLFGAIREGRYRGVERLFQIGCLSPRLVRRLKRAMRVEAGRKRTTSWTELAN
ncbi:MAG: hypothetical protein M1840_001467 [Geoglossum simile]|nr:MAG: hypothetical protein M1840_001467 [Geoglossum simile]